MSSPFRVAVTLDVDPDANQAVPGRTDAVSPPLAAGVAKFDAVREGLDLALAALAEEGVPATVFLEARTAEELARRGADLAALARDHEVGCHGLRHEDLLGVVSGLPLPRHECFDLLSEAVSAIAHLTEARPQGFRAPYTRVNDTVLAVLRDLGFAYDSSMTELVADGRAMAPYRVFEDEPVLWEAPLPMLRDSRGRRMSCYLWPMLEGRREPEEYVDAVSMLSAAHPGGLFQIALHPWHLLVSEHGEPLPAERARGHCAAFQQIIRRVGELPATAFVTLAACVPGGCA